MLVLQVIARVNLGGTAKYLFTLSKQLPKLGIKTVIVTGDVQEGEIEDPGLKKVDYIKIPNLGRKINLGNDLKAFINKIPTEFGLPLLTFFGQLELEQKPKEETED